MYLTDKNLNYPDNCEALWECSISRHQDKKKLDNDHSNCCLLLAATMSIAPFGEISFDGNWMFSWKKKEVTRKAGSRIFARDNRKITGILFLQC